MGLSYKFPFGMTSTHQTPYVLFFSQSLVCSYIASFRATVCMIQYRCQNPAFPRTGKWCLTRIWCILASKQQQQPVSTLTFGTNVPPYLRSQISSRATWLFKHHRLTKFPYDSQQIPPAENDAYYNHPNVEEDYPVSDIEGRGSKEKMAWKTEE